MLACAGPPRLRSGAWCQARLLSRRQLRRLAASYGTAALSGSLHAPRLVPGLSMIEMLGRLAPLLGAFHVLVVPKPVEPGDQAGSSSAIHADW